MKHTLMLTALAIGAAVLLAIAAGVVDAQAAGTGFLIANGAAGVDFKALTQAVETAVTKLNGRCDKIAEDHKEIRAQLLELAQARATKPTGGLGEGDGNAGELAELIARSDGLSAFLKKQTPSCGIDVPSRLVVRNAITSTPPGQSNPLVQPDRGRGIVAPPQQRLTIRGLFSAIPTSSGSVDVVTESSFTNNAAIQGGASPTSSGEGEAKAESDMTFAIENLTIPTIAHWIRASRQILSDAPLLQAYIENRLLYGLALKEEEQFLVGSYGKGGLNVQAIAFTGGGTNATALDTLARAFNQLSVNNLEPSGVILHPTDWLNIVLTKDSEGRYLLGDPANMPSPALWGRPVVPTPSQTLGRFTALDARQAGYLADREDATVRISEHTNDDFIRNMVRVLCEERALLVIERPTAIVCGNLSHAG